MCNDIYQPDRLKIKPFVRFGSQDKYLLSNENSLSWRIGFAI